MFNDTRSLIVTRHLKVMAKKEVTRQRMALCQLYQKDNGKVLGFAVFTEDCTSGKYLKKKKEHQRMNSFY